MSDKEIQELVKEERRRYAREWRARNPQKVQAANKRYWEKRALMRMKNGGSETTHVDA